MKNILVVLITFLYSLNPAFAEKDEHGHDHDEKESYSQDTEEKHTDGDNHSDHEGEEEGHEHKEGEESDADHKEDEEHDDHGEESEGHAHDEEEVEGEGGSVVGPDKGILEKGKEGFRLAPEAMKTFELKTESIKTKVIEIVRPALVEIKNDKFIYRIRDGWIKKIPVKVLKKDSQRATVDISQFKDGDQIITNGVGFVRTAELVAEEGVSHGHSH